MKNIIFRLTVLLFLGVFVANCATTDPNVSTAQLHFATGDYEAMIEEANIAIQNNPENGNAYYYKAVGQVQLALTKPAGERKELYADARSNFMKAQELYEAQGVRSTEADGIPDDILGTWGFEVNQAVDKLDDNFHETHNDSLTLAIYHFENALTILPDSAYVAGYIAEGMIIQERYEEVEELMEGLIASGMAAREDYIVLANARLQMGNFDGAYELMSKVAEDYPFDPNIVEWIAYYYIENDQMDEATAIVNDLIEDDPDEFRYRLLYRDIFLEEMNRILQEAQEILSAVPELNAKIREAARARNRDDAEIERMINEADRIQAEAEEVYKKADAVAMDIANQFAEFLERNPEHSAAWREKGVMYRNRSVSYLELRDATNDNEKAAEYDAQAKEILEETYPIFEHVVALDEHDQQAWTVLFQIYSNLNMMDKAAEAMEKAGL